MKYFDKNTAKLIREEMTEALKAVSYVTVRGIMMLILLLGICTRKKKGELMKKQALKPKRFRLNNEYTITDLCYIKHADLEWDAVCDSDMEVYQFAGYTVLANAYTPNGDGTYHALGQTGSVDSGTLALVAGTVKNRSSNCMIHFKALSDAKALAIWAKCLKQL